MKKGGFFILPAALLLVITSTIALHLKRANPQRQVRPLFIRLQARKEGNWARRMANYCLCDNVLYAIETKTGKLFISRQKKDDKEMTFAGAMVKGQLHSTLEIVIGEKRERLTLSSKGKGGAKSYLSMRRELERQMELAEQSFCHLADIKRSDVNRLIPHETKKKALVRTHLKRAFENLRAIYSPPSSAPPS